MTSSSQSHEISFNDSEVILERTVETRLSTHGHIMVDGKLKFWLSKNEKKVSDFFDEDACESVRSSEGKGFLSIFGLFNLRIKYTNCINDL